MQARIRISDVEREHVVDKYIYVCGFVRQIPASHSHIANRTHIRRVILGASRPQFRRMRGIRGGSDEVLFGSGSLTVLKWQVSRGGHGHAV